jgi:hypothetical protein
MFCLETIVARNASHPTEAWETLLRLALSNECRAAAEAPSEPPLTRPSQPMPKKSEAAAVYYY